MSIQVIQEYTVSEYRVMRSAAGYYVGCACFDPKMPEAGCNLPYTRDSEYMTEEGAKRLLSQFILIEECETEAEQDAVAEYRMAINEGADVYRAVYDALWVFHTPGKVEEDSEPMPEEQEPYQFELDLTS